MTSYHALLSKNGLPFYYMDTFKELLHCYPEDVNVFLFHIFLKMHACNMLDLECFVPRMCSVQICITHSWRTIAQLEAI